MFTGAAAPAALPLSSPPAVFQPLQLSCGLALLPPLAEAGSWDGGLEGLEAGELEGLEVWLQGGGSVRNFCDRSTYEAKKAPGPRNISREPGQTRPIL